MDAREVGHLVAHLTHERRRWVLGEVQFQRTTCEVFGLPYQHRLCLYVEARLQGKRPAEPLSHRRPCLHGKVVCYKGVRYAN